MDLKILIGRVEVPNWRRLFVTSTRGGRVQLRDEHSDDSGEEAGVLLLEPEGGRHTRWESQPSIPKSSVNFLTFSRSSVLTVGRVVDRERSMSDCRGGTHPNHLLKLNILHPPFQFPLWLIARLSILLIQHSHHYIVHVSKRSAPSGDGCSDFCNFYTDIKTLFTTFYPSKKFIEILNSFKHRSL